MGAIGQGGYLKKINVDGSSVDSSSEASIAGICQNAHGVIVAGFTKKVRAASILVVETVAVKTLFIGQPFGSSRQLTAQCHWSYCSSEIGDCVHGCMDLHSSPGDQIQENQGCCPKTLEEISSHIVWASAILLAYHVIASSTLNMRVIIENTFLAAVLLIFHVLGFQSCFCARLCLWG